MQLERINKIKAFVAGNQLQEGLDELENLFNQIDSELLEQVVMLRSRWDRLYADYHGGLIVYDVFQTDLNKISFSILYLLKQLDHSNRKNRYKEKTSSKGRILYDIKKHMPVSLETRCTVRLAHNLSVIIQSFEVSQETIIEEIRVSNIMEVELVTLSDDKDFKIRSVNSKDQIVDESDYTEWIFWVTPLKLGNHKLLLKVSVIQVIDNVERRKEIVLEKEIEVVNIDENLIKEESTNWIDSKIIVDTLSQTREVEETYTTINADKKPHRSRGFWSNWGKLLNNSLSAGVALISNNTIDIWIEERVYQLKIENDQSVYIDIAYEVAKMSNEEWKPFISYLKEKEANNEYVEHIYSFCNFVVSLENENIKQILSYPTEEAFEIFLHNINEMETYEIGAYIGIFKAYSSINQKSKAIISRLNEIINANEE